MTKILCIRPHDETTEFLNKASTYLFNNLKDNYNFEFHKIHPNEISHTICLEKIRSLSENDLIIFLGHGNKTYLQGAIDNNSTPPFLKSQFINESNIDIFNNKKVFCLSCNSSQGLGEIFINKGTKTFVGFGKLPTSMEEDENNDLTKDSIGNFKGKLSEIIKLSLVKAIQNNFSFEELYFEIKLRVNIYILEIAKRDYADKHKKRLHNILYSMKNEMIVFGDKTLKII